MSAIREGNYPMDEEEDNSKRKKKLIAIVIIILVLSIVIPIAFMSLFLKEEGESIYYLSYKKLHDKHENSELKDGDIVYIKDIFSGIWYNESSHYTYMTFKSMDDYRTDPWGYDAGYPEDITEEFEVGDNVILKIEMEQEMRQGIPTLVGHIKSITHTD
jgi:hypothetical protein